MTLNNYGKDSKVAAQRLWLPQQRAAPKHRDVFPKPTEVHGVKNPDSLAMIRSA
jgi:hypothetical protein